MNETITLKCKESNRSSYSPNACGRLATMAVLPWSADGGATPICGTHVGAEKRKRYGKRELVELTPEIVAEITTRLATR